MEEYISKANNLKPILIRLHKDDIIQVSIDTLLNPKDVKVQRYLTVYEDNPKLRVSINNTDNVIGLIQEHIVVRYKLKEVWDLFIKFLFRTPKINNIKFRVIKGE